VADIFDQLAAPKTATPAAAPRSADIFDQLDAPQQQQTPQRLSDSLPQPDQVVQDATAHAGRIATALAAEADPNAGTISASTPSMWDRIMAPVREGAIGRAVEQSFPEGSPLRRMIGTPSMTTQADREQPGVGHAILPFEAATSQPGAIRGAAEFAGGLTTPESLLLMAGSGGLGTLGKQLGTGLVSRLISAGFSADMLHSAYQQIPALRDSWNQQDWPQVRQQLVKLTLGTGMAALGVRHALKGGVAPAAAEERAAPREVSAPPEQQFTSTGQPIRAAAPDIFDQVAAPKQENTHAETKVQVANEGRPIESAGRVQPAAAGPATTVQAATAVEQPRAEAQVAALKPGSTPPTVYHGTGNDFGEFEQGRTKDDSLYGPGYYHTEDPAIASSYAKGGSGNVRPAKLAIRNVFDVDAPADPKLARIIGSEAATNHELYHDAVQEFGNKSEVNDWLDANGYDGITHVGGKLAGKGERLHRVWIALHSEQVRPAFQAAEESAPSVVRSAIPPEVEAAKARLKARFKGLATSESGEQSNELSTEDLKDLGTVGAHFLKQASGKVTEWTDSMVEHFGEDVRPYLVHAYAAARQRMGEEAGAAKTPPVPESYANVPPSSLTLDPNRFQFKFEGIGHKGVTDQFRNVEKWNPKLAGTMHVWYDPADGKTYPVNGNHRTELAQRLGDENVPEGVHVRYLDAKDAQDARAQGALINIGEGNGTALDIGKFLRDTGLTAEQLKSQEGIELHKKEGRQGAALANLANPIFHDVVHGVLPVERAAIIGSGVPNHADQTALYDLIRKREQGGKRLTNDQLNELIRMTNRTPTVTESTADDAQGSMFGEEEMTRSLLPEKAIVSDYVRDQLKGEKKLFGLVGKQSAADKLEAAGNVIKTGDNAQVAEQANQGITLYDKLSVHAGPIDAILDQAAQRLAAGDPSVDVKQQAYRQIRDHLSGQIAQLTGGGDAEGLREGRIGEAPSGQQDSLDGGRVGGHDSGAAGAVRPAESVQDVAPPKPLTAAEHNARAAALRLKARASKLLTDESGEQRNELDPQDLKDFATVGAHYLDQAGGKVKEWSQAMVDEFGEHIRPYLPQIHAEVAGPKPPVAESSGVYFGSGLGALEPLFREAKAEGDALLTKRNEALAAAKLAADTPAETKAGEAIRAYLTSERDLWAARANQAIDIVSRKVTPKIQDREALGIMREFRHRPGELQQFIDGSHPFLQEVNGGPAEADKNLAPLLPRMREALGMLTRPLTQRENTTDRLFTNIADKSLREGQAGGWLGSRWQPDEYVPHLLSEKGTGDVATPPSIAGRQMGKIGKYFGFGERRNDRYPTVVHAVADGIIPKTLDPSAAFTVHADKFAQARATHLLEAHLADSGLGKWGSSADAPEGWVQLAGHADEFKKHFAIEDPNSVDPETGRGEMRVGMQGLYVPPFIDKALSAVTDPDYTAKVPGFAKLRTMQRGLKEAILGLSGFHLLTENAMAATDIGVGGMMRAFRTPRESLGSIMNERDLIASGGTTSVQGSTMDAYRNLRPGTIPTRGEVIRAYLPGTKQALAMADHITRFTFNNVQRRFKIEAFALHRDAWIHDNPHATPDQLGEAKKGIASYVNGVYGGLHWENMGIPRAMVEVSRALFLAPDWSGSNIALAKYAVDARLSGRELPFRDHLAGAVTKESAQARLSRAFWTKQLVGGLIGTQMLSLLFSGELSKRPFQVYQGTDKDGREVYQNVLFRGSSGDLLSLAGKMEDHGLLVGFGNFVGSKAAPVTKLGMHAYTGLDDLGRQIAPKRLGLVENTVRSVGTLAGDISPVPIVLRNVQHTMMSDESDKFLWSERMLGLFGPQAQHVAPDGMRMTKHGLAPARQKR
jgi:hypothetical protein